MNTIFDRTGTFAANKSLLEQHLEFTAEQTRCKRITLTKPNGEVMVIKAGPGKFVSCAFIDYLSFGKGVFTIDAELHEMVRDFFGPIWDEPGHATVDFLREPGVTITIERTKTAGGR